jgi:hypothetical protein
LILGQATSPAAKRGVRPARPPYVQAGVRNAAEERFVRKLANEFTRTLAVVAGNPDASFPRGSFADRVRSAYMQVQPSRRAALRPGALKLVPMTGAARPSAALAVTNRDLSAIRAQTTGLPPSLRMEFRTLLKQRFDALRPQLDTLARSIAAAPMTLPRTWIEGGVAAETSPPDRQEITLNQPQVLAFRWRSEEPRAVSGYWELRQQATGLLPERVLATGTASDDATRSGVQGFFEIDFAKYLPPRPPTRGVWTYHVRIKPMPDAQAVARGARPNRSIGRLGTPKAVPAGPPRDPEGVGPWSAPVVIHYGASTTPPTTFHDVYRRARFHLDSIKLIEDQYGPGGEEFHLAGFIQSSSPSGVGNQYRLGSFAALNDEGQEHTFGDSVAFDLPSAGDFPRAYTLVLSILEEDDGGTIGDWQEVITRAARDALSDEVDAVFKAQLAELREQLKDKATAEMWDASIDLLIAAATDDFYSLWLRLIVMAIVNAVEAGLPDDYYGTEVVTFLMPTNRADIIHASSAFVATHSLSPTERLTGQVQENGTLVVRPKYVRFYGLPSWTEAGWYNGIVDIKVHWTLSGRGL